MAQSMEVEPTSNAKATASARMNTFLISMGDKHQDSSMNVANTLKIVKAKREKNLNKRRQIKAKMEKLAGDLYHVEMEIANDEERLQELHGKYLRALGLELASE